MTETFVIEFKDFEKFKYSKFEIILPELNNNEKYIENFEYELLDYIHISIYSYTNNDYYLEHTIKYFNEHIPVFESIYNVKYYTLQNNKLYLPVYLNFDNYLESFINNTKNPYLIDVTIKLNTIENYITHN